MNSKQMIEIEGLPDGWKAIAYRKALWGEWYLTERGIVRRRGCTGMQYPTLIVEQIKPRRIVLEETDRDRDYMKDEMITIDDRTCVEVYGDKIWRIKEE